MNGFWEQWEEDRFYKVNLGERIAMNPLTIPMVNKP